jgi:hypothetical protein
MLASKQDVDWVEVPGEPGCRFGFRPLSGDDLDEAQAAAIRDMAESLGREAAGIFGEMSTSDATAEAIKKAEAANKADGEPDDPLDDWSKRVLLIGLVAWEGPNYEGVKCDAAGKKQLMEPSRSFAALQVLNRSRVDAGKSES